MSLRLTEQDADPASGATTLHVEAMTEEAGAAFLVICGMDENPSEPSVGETINLNREQVVSLRDYLNGLLTG